MEGFESKATWKAASGGATAMHPAAVAGRLGRHFLVILESLAATHGVRALASTQYHMRNVVPGENRLEQAERTTEPVQ